jgi:TM2 domain-containing membrane protein YozV
MDSQTKLTLTDNYGQTYKISAVFTKIGAAPQSDIIIDEPGVLDNHAEINLEQSGWVLHDVTGQNNIKINGQQIQTQSKLNNRDVISMGSAVLRVSLQEIQTDAASVLQSDTVSQEATVDFSGFRSTGGTYVIDAEAAKNQTPSKKQCRACGQLIHPEAEICPHCGVRQMEPPKPEATPIVGRKNKSTAALLGILLGGFGAHKFYLGQPVAGLFYLIFIWTWLPVIIGFFEGISYLAMSDEQFAAKYR